MMFMPTLSTIPATDLDTPISRAERQDKVRADARNNHRTWAQRLRRQGRVTSEDMRTERLDREETLISAYARDNGGDRASAHTALERLGQLGPKDDISIRREEHHRYYVAAIQRALDEGDLHEAQKVAQKSCHGQRRRPFQRTEDFEFEKRELAKAVADTLIGHFRTVLDKGAAEGGPEEFVEIAKRLGRFVRHSYGSLGLDTREIQKTEVQAVVHEQLTAKVRDGFPAYHDAKTQFQQLGLLLPDAPPSETVLSAVREEALVRLQNEHQSQSFSKWCKAWENGGVIGKGSFCLLPEVITYATEDVIAGIPDELAHGAFSGKLDRWVDAGVLYRTEVISLPEVRDAVSGLLRESLATGYPNERFIPLRNRWERCGVVTAAEVNGWPEAQASAKDELALALPNQRHHKTLENRLAYWVDGGVLTREEALSDRRIVEFAERELSRAVPLERAEGAFSKGMEAWVKLGVGTADHFRTLPAVVEAARRDIASAPDELRAQMHWDRVGVKVNSVETSTV